jgi:hypothetical protein
MLNINIHAQSSSRDAGDAQRSARRGGMPGRELYRRYRRRIEELADEQCCAEVSLTALHALLQDFQHNAAALGSSAAGFVRDELADQLEHESLCATRKRRRDVLIAAVKAFDSMTFSESKP